MPGDDAQCSDATDQCEECGGPIPNGRPSDWDNQCPNPHCPSRIRADGGTVENGTDDSEPDVFEPEPKDPADMEPLPFDYEYGHAAIERADNIHEQQAIEAGRRREWGLAYQHAECIFHDGRMHGLRDKISVYKNGSRRSVDTATEQDGGRDE